MQNVLKLLSARTDHEHHQHQQQHQQQHHHHHHQHHQADGGDRDNNNDARLTLANWSAAMAAEHKSKYPALTASQASSFSLAVSQHTSGYKQQLQAALDEEKRQQQQQQDPSSQQQQQQQQQQAAAAAAALRTPVKRRIRRRATSSSDPAEQLTEMSVRGLNLFRYATVSEGIYKCLECAKTDILKTFKNKYSFQRHAFLYHEGHQRKVFPCPVCAKEFSRPDKMKNHMKTVHECYMPKAIDFPQVPFLLPP